MTYTQKTRSVSTRRQAPAQLNREAQLKARMQAAALARLVK